MIEDTKEVILKVVRNAGEPLTVKKVLDLLPRPFKVSEDVLNRFLDEQVQAGALHEWPSLRSKKRYWFQDPEAVIKKGMLQVLSQKALSQTELQKSLRKLFFRSPKYKAKELTRTCLRQLLEEGRVYKYPRMPRKRSDFYGVLPPDPAPYLGKVKTELKKVFEKLRPFGVTEEEVYEALSGRPVRPSPPAPDEEPVPTEKDREAPHDVKQHILDKAREVEPRAGGQALVSLKKLRHAAGLEPRVFDRAVLALAREGTVWLHRHAYPAGAGEDEVVRDDRGNCYVGLVIRP
jgi:hypothetical protein